MSENFHHHSRRYILSQQKRCTRVAEIVESSVLEPCLHEEAAEQEKRQHSRRDLTRCYCCPKTIRRDSNGKQENHPARD